jgi:hypothetical protein
MRRRRLLAMLGAIALTVSLAAATDAASARDVNRLRVAGATSTFGLVTASSAAELAVYTEKGEDWAFMELDLGVHAAAGREPFEIRAVRTSYDKPIEATRVTPSGNQALPSGLVTDLSGLTDFATVTLKDSRGRTALSQTIDFCPNGYAQRISKDAPVDSHYPHECAFNPYALGGVWGIQRGYAVPLMGEDGYIDGDVDDLPKPGRYRAEVKVNSAYAKALGIPPSSTTARLRVKVVKGDFDDEEEFRASRASSDDNARAASRPVTAASIPADAPKPDLRSLPAWGIGADRNDVVFSATVWNGGRSPLVVDGYRRRGADIMDAYQYVLDEDGQQVGYKRVGSMEWDPRDEHFHWHFKDFARYSLVDKNKKQVYVSTKEAFCLANTDAVDYTVPGADWHPGNSDLETACGERNSLAVREILASGSGDTYDQYRPGQALSLKGRPNGTYYIKVEANPMRRLTESDTGNNISYRKITVGGKAGKRTVKAEKVGIVEELDWFDFEELSARVRSAG